MNAVCATKSILVSLQQEQFDMYIYQLTAIIAL